MLTSSLHAAETVASDAGAGKPALTVTLTQAKTALAPVKLSANGTLAAWQEAVIGAEVNGLRVLELKVDVGDVVKAGQVLAVFSAEGVQADVALARAALSEASANAVEASANADRARAVQGSGALSAQQIGQYLTQEMTARARVELATAQLDAQLLRLRHTQVLAPDAGIISGRSATLGAVLAPGAEMFRLIRQGRLEWRAELTSAEIGRITPGAVVLVTAPGGTQVKGRVRKVAPTVDAVTRNGLVYVDVPASAASAFKPGMFARGEFELGASSALSVLQSAVLLRDGFNYVMRVGTDNRVSQRKVQTGRTLGERVEILAGLAPEDQLVATGAGFLSEGDLVRVLDSSRQNHALTPTGKAQAAAK